ncbi:arginine--tRNA ligase [Glaciecola punicea]|jgi:arginyl-tRNA synthetase|uniref:arginine--tRNA ligase n=1 Tax=Glaciecola punicea TaxID=56804 RepID=UPI000871C826|nr:arginine--tRNA ligase [Glaciecola punicea]OFA30065.1 arginine--tRNA ligase [Glaciecola punicea]
MNIQQLLVERFTSALNILGFTDAPVPVAKNTKKGFGEYQFNGAMGLAKKLKQNPRDIAQQIIDAVDISDMASTLEIAGPGFINIHINNMWLSAQLSAVLSDKRLGIDIVPAKNVVVDYSAPNLAKEMHVGHLRSTIIGDAVVRCLAFLGHNVIRQNHMGDWGTQFGMLLAHLQDKLAQDQVAETALSDLEDFYREAKVRFDNEEGFADTARQYVVRLQGGDKECLALWKNFIDVSISHSEDIYKTLGVSLSRQDVMGESAYNDDLATVVSILKEKGIAQEDAGAQVVFLQELADKNGKPAVYIVQKSGGGYLYATTDLAAIRHRSSVLQADRTLIFTDARQALHFKQTEMVARKANFMQPDEAYQHCPFGMMLGKDNKPFKTRTGGTVKLIDLLDEAVERAEKLVLERKPDIDPQQLAQMKSTLGIGAVKYADLSKNRTTDYVFDWNAMLSFEGNTAPYLQYAYTRIQSIFEKAKFDPAAHAQSTIEMSIEQDAEKALCLHLLQCQNALELVAIEATPHILCTYLYELASLYMRFYEACPILKDDVSRQSKHTRLSLCVLTASTLKLGLDLLGIGTMQKM